METTMIAPADSLFAPAPGLARHDHPATAKDAARSVSAKTGTQRRAVLEVIANAGVLGCTDEEGALLASVSENAYRPRRVELYRAGMIEQGAVQLRTTSGRLANTWVATKSGFAALGRVKQ